MQKKHNDDETREGGFNTLTAYKHACTRPEPGKNWAHQTQACVFFNHVKTQLLSHNTTTVPLLIGRTELKRGRNWEVYKDSCNLNEYQSK